MEKKLKQEYESPEVILFDISASSVFQGSWGDGSIGNDDENELFTF